MGCTERRASIGFPMLLSIAAFLFVGVTLGALGVRSFRASEAQTDCATMCQGSSDPNCMTYCSQSSGGSSGGGSYGGSGCPQRDCYAHCQGSMCNCNSMTPDPASCTSGGTTGGGSTGGAGGSTTTAPPPPPEEKKKPTLMKTPEMREEMRVGNYIEMLHSYEEETGEKVFPCAPEFLLKGEYTESPVGPVGYKIWWEEVLETYGVQGVPLKDLSICPDEDEVEKETGTIRSEDCNLHVKNGVQRTYQVYGEKGEEAWEESMHTYLENQPGAEDCPFSVEDLSIVKEHGEKAPTCDDSDSCDPGFFCDKSIEHRVQKPLLRGMAANLLGQESFYGTCTALRREGDSWQCFRDIDCTGFGKGGGVVCNPSPQPMMACFDADTCPPPVPGWCGETPHDAAEEDAVVNDLRPVDYQDAKDAVVKETGVADVPLDEVVEKYDELVTEHIVEAAEEAGVELEEAAVTEDMRDAYEKGDETPWDGEYEPPQETPVDTEDLAKVVGEGVEICLELKQHEDELPESTVALVNAGLMEFSKVLTQVVVEEEEITGEDIRKLVTLVEEIKEAIPDDALEEIFSGDEVREERGYDMSNDLRSEFGGIDRMLSWIGDLIAALQETDYAGKDPAKEERWADLLADARRTYYEEVKPECDALITTLRQGDFEEVEGHMESCGERIEEDVFGDLAREMKPEIEALMMGGDPTLMAIMMRLGPPPMDEDHEGGPGGPGGGEDCFAQCERHFGVEDIIRRSDEHVYEENPECRENDDVAGCEELFRKWDDRLFAEAHLPREIMEGFGQCSDMCERMEGGGGEHDGRQDRSEMERMCGEASRHAGEACCRMNGGERIPMSCVDDMLLGWRMDACFQVHPSDLKVPGVDTDCSEDTGFDTHNCERYWRSAESKCKVNYQMDIACFKDAVRAFEDKDCIPGENDSFWTMDDQWQDHRDGEMSGGCRFDEVNVLFGDAIGKVYGVYCPYGSNMCTGHDEREVSITFEQQQGQKWSTSQCSGGGAGGGGDMEGWECLNALWDNGTGQKHEVTLWCKDGQCNDGGMMRPKTDPAYSDFRPCTGEGGGAGGGGSEVACVEVTTTNGTPRILNNCEEARDERQNAVWSCVGDDNLWHDAKEYGSNPHRVPCTNMPWPGGGTGGGNGSCTRATVTLHSGDVVNNVNCWNWACTGQKSGSTQTFSFNVSDMTDPASCSGGGMPGGGSTGGGGGAATGTPQPGCSYSYGELVSMSNGAVTVTGTVSWASCPIETPNLCNIPSGTVGYEGLRVGTPSACASGSSGGGTTYPSGGTTHVCIYRGTYVNGSPAGEDLKMVEGYYYGVSSGKRYEPSQVSNMMTCDCDPLDGIFNDCGSAPSGSTYPSGTSTYPSGTTTTQPASCVAHSASWGTRPDGTNVPGPLISKAGESTVTLPNGTVEPMSNFREFGPWTCQSASRGGIFHAIGLLLRSLVAGF